MDLYPSGIPLNDMIPFYEAVSRDEPIKLEWVCPGRRNPKEETKQGSATQQEQNTVASSSINTKPTDSQSTSKLAEFDFDEGSSQQDLLLFAASMTGGPGMAQAAALPLRRVVGSGRHPRQPRVANMDKILSDLFKSRKESSAPQPLQSETGSTVSAAPSASIQEPSASNENGQSNMCPEPTENIATAHHAAVDNSISNTVQGTVPSEVSMDTGDIPMSDTPTMVPESFPNELELEIHEGSLAAPHANDISQSMTGCMNQSGELITCADSHVINTDSIFSAPPVTMSEPVVSELPDQMARTHLMDQSDSTN
ncbi:unnamed protein product [Echinostoma caproni]|uniref:Protein aurora borealis n=1 Tax=Echinostoma caproni TaxID=27848 RepID=A0A183B6A9_9TREM|nr:unnamed protein product [Echinostoma caproni]